MSNVPVIPPMNNDYQAKRAEAWDRYYTTLDHAAVEKLGDLGRRRAVFGEAYDAGWQAALEATRGI